MAPSSLRLLFHLDQRALGGGATGTAGALGMPGAPGIPGGTIPGAPGMAPNGEDEVLAFGAGSGTGANAWERRLRASDSFTCTTPNCDVCALSDAASIRPAIVESLVWTTSFLRITKCSAGTLAVIC